MDKFAKQPSATTKAKVCVKRAMQPAPHDYLKLASDKKVRATRHEHIRPLAAHAIDPALPAL